MTNAFGSKLINTVCRLAHLERERMRVYRNQFI